MMQTNLTSAANVDTRRVTVSLEGVRKAWQGSTALHETSLKVYQGEFLTLLGPSGCGKTTLLNLIAGFVQPDVGEVFIDGEVITDKPPYQRQIGIVFQNYALFPHMNVAQNIGYGLRMRGVAKAEIAQRVGQMMGMIKLDAFGQRRPKELSGGQQQRVALARALVVRPKVLLLDEPFSALDKNLRASMQEEIKSIQRKLGVTTVFVTHDQSEALAMSDRIAVMSQGRIRQIDVPDLIYRRPRDPFVATFVGDVNILPARCVARSEDYVQLLVGQTNFEVSSAGVPDALPGSMVDLYVRPECIRLAPAGADSALTGTVTSHVFQGDHLNIHVDVPAAGERRVLVRTPGLDALRQWPVGSVAGLMLGADDLSAFPAESSTRPAVEPSTPVGYLPVEDAAVHVAA